MSYDAELARRVRERLKNLSDLSEKEMFGGVGFMLRRNMACGVLGQELIIRVGPEQHRRALSLPGARIFDFSGRPMKGWVFVSPAGFPSETDLDNWIQMGTSYALTLPPK